jgi:RNA polymerase sigma-70 factor (ECF subfamily)
LHQYKQFTDFELVDLITENDQKAAFAELMHRHNQLVTSTVLNMVGDMEDTKEVLQQVFIRFYKGLPNFKKNSRISTYLTRIAINQSLNLLKRRQTESRRITTMELTNDFVAATDNVAFEHKEVVQLALLRLKPSYRAVVTLRMISGYSTEETAQILKLPKGTVMSRLKRAMDKLKVIIKEDLNYER